MAELGVGAGCCLMKSSIDDVRPVHVAAGIGGAQRDFLAVCLGVCDDAGLLEHVKRSVEKAWRKVPGVAPMDVTSVESSAKRWRDADLSDDQLRVCLWTRLRRAWGLGPGVTRIRPRLRTPRGRTRCCCDAVARGQRLPGVDKAHVAEGVAQGGNGMGYGWAG